MERPEGLEDLSSLRVVDLKKNLKAFKSNFSGVKADLILRAYAIYYSCLL